MFFQQMPDLRFDHGVDRLERIKFLDACIMFQKLDGEETRRDVLIPLYIECINLCRNDLDGVVNIRAIGEHGDAVTFQPVQGVGKFFEEWFDAAGFAADRLDNRRTEIFFKFREIELQAFLCRIVAHIERKKHRNMKFRKLRGQIQAALGNGGVHHIQNQVNAGSRQLLKRDILLRRTGGQRIRPPAGRSG